MIKTTEIEEYKELPTQTELKTLGPKMPETCLTSRYAEQLRTHLGNPIEWKNKTVYQRKKIESISDSTDFVALFPEGFEEFTTKMQNYLYPDVSTLKSSQRAENNYFLHKFKNIVRGISCLLKELGHNVFDEIIDFDDKDWVLMVKHFISLR